MRGNFRRRGYEREKRKYHPTASRMTSGSNYRHLNKPQTEEARRSVRPAYQGQPVKLQHSLGLCQKERAASFFKPHNIPPSPTPSTSCWRLNEWFDLHDVAIPLLL